MWFEGSFGFHLFSNFSISFTEIMAGEEDLSQWPPSLVESDHLSQGYIQFGDCLIFYFNHRSLDFHKEGSANIYTEQLRESYKNTLEWSYCKWVVKNKPSERMKVNSLLDPSSLPLVPGILFQPELGRWASSMGGAGEHTGMADTQKLPTDIVESDSGGVL